MAHEFIRYVETKLVLAAVLMACLCGVTAFGLYQHVAAVHADTETLMAGNLRARHLSTTLALLQDAETGQRGYLLTGRTEYLEPYTHALTQIDQSLATLHVDYAHDGAAKAMITVLDRHVRDKLAELKETVELRRRDGLEAAQGIVLQNTGKRMMDVIRTTLHQLLDTERSAIDRTVQAERAAAKQSLNLWLLAASLALLPACFCLALALRDVRQGRRESTRLTHSSSHDALTGLLNRPALLARLEEALVRHPQYVGILYLDLDGFKPINDELGHAAGDLVLAEVGRCLEEAVRPYDVVARIGGDEFVVLIEHCASQALLAVLARHIEVILETISLPELRGRTIGGSVGAAYSAQDGTRALTLLQNADAAMYARKAQLRQARLERSPPRLATVGGSQQTEMSCLGNRSQRSLHR